MVEHVFEHCHPPGAQKGEVGGYQDAQEYFFLVGKLEEAE